MKYVVCTGYCGEQEMPDCVKALAFQGVEVDHHIIAYRSEIDAHNEIYKIFNEAPPDFIRAKIDADVVLNDNALASIAKNIGTGDWVDPLVHDFFSNTQIHAGIAIYGSAVTFDIQTNTLKCDRGVAHYKRHIDIGCIGTHAHMSEGITAFHFGFHRGLKSQLPIYESMKRAPQTSQRVIAIIGFELAQCDLYHEWHTKAVWPTSEEHNYGPRLDELYDTYVTQNMPVPRRSWW